MKWSLEVMFGIGIVVLLLLFEIFRLVKDRMKSVLLMILVVVASFLILKFYFSALL